MNVKYHQVNTVEIREYLDRVPLMNREQFIVRAHPIAPPSPILIVWCPRTRGWLLGPLPAMPPAGITPARDVRYLTAADLAQWGRRPPHMLGRPVRAPRVVCIGDQIGWTGSVDGLPMTALAPLATLGGRKDHWRTATIKLKPGQHTACLVDQD